MEKLEEKIAHLDRLTQELSEVVAAQAAEITKLKSQVALLIQREAARETDEGVILGDERPPHW